MVFYVSSKNGSDANDCRTLAGAFKSIQHAVHVARPGDTLLIAPGIYDQDMVRQVEAARAAGLTLAVAGSES